MIVDYILFVMVIFQFIGISLIQKLIVGIMIKVPVLREKI